MATGYRLPSYTSTLPATHVSYEKDTFLLIAADTTYQCTISIPGPGLTCHVQTIPGQSYVFIGVQIPLNYTLGYRYQFSRRLSAQVQGGLIAAPFERYTLKLLEGFGLDPNLSRVIDRSFRQGSSASLGVSVHANSPWYGTLYGQYIHFLAGPITPADGLGVYFNRDFSGFNLLNSPAFVFDLQSNIWVAGLRLGRSFQFNNSRFGLNTELGLGKILTTKNTFSSNRPAVDALGVTQRLYDNLNNEIDTKLRQYGYLPTLNVLLTYRLN